MSLDINKLIKAVKRAAVDAVAAQKPVAWCVGEVVSVSPISIKVDQKMTLTDTQIILTTSVTDFEVDMTVNHETELCGGGSGDSAFDDHAHEYKGRKRFLVHLGLQVGEKVHLLRCDGGQKYIVLDRVR